MANLRRIRADNYLKNFIDYCKVKFGDNLMAIVIYGSYAWSYFDKKESDYDVFIIFKNFVPEGKEDIAKRFRKITIQYYITAEELVRKVHLGHWTSYITLLKSAKILYSTKEYEKFLRKLGKINLLEKLIDIASIEGKTLQRIENLKKLKGYKASKWALPSIRVQLQMLTYLKYNKLIWDLKENLEKNKENLTDEEILFLEKLDGKVKSRSNEFSRKDRDIALGILSRLNGEIILNLKDVIRGKHDKN